ncbi:MAG: hypothetical protein EXR77_08560 [Myxococcales bacterium]|nr:hypothetical protein [Myxococcales bacterium]
MSPDRSAVAKRHAEVVALQLRRHRGRPKDTMPSLLRRFKRLRAISGRSGVSCCACWANGAFTATMLASGCGLARTSLARLTVTLGAALLVVPGPVFGQAPLPKNELETAVSSWVAPLQQRLVVRNGDGGLDVWLIGATAFEVAVETVKRAVAARKTLDGGITLQRWTFLEPDKSWLLDLQVADEALRLRLTRHVTGSLFELQQTGTAAEAPRWTPPYRPQPVYLLHGGAVR